MDIVHHDDDTIDVHITLSHLAADGVTTVEDVFVLIRTDFWSNARVHERYRCLIGADLDDVDVLLVAVFERLAENLREYGVDYARTVYLTPTALLTEVLPSIAGRLARPLYKRLGLPKTTHPAPTHLPMPAFTPRTHRRHDERRR